MRKKIIALLLLSSALLSLCACKKGDGENAAESVYSDPTYFNGTTTVKVSDEAAVAALTSGEMEVQTSEDGPFVTIKLGTTAEKFTPLFPEGEKRGEFPNTATFFSFLPPSPPRSRFAR